jgi:hypothetical protein
MPRGHILPNLPVRSEQSENCFVTRSNSLNRNDTIFVEGRRSIDVQSYELIFQQIEN